jgi:hypothetical protein
MKKKSTITLILLFTYSFASAQVMKSMDNKRNSIPIPIDNFDSIKTIVSHWYHSHSGFQEQIGMYGILSDSLFVSNN